MNTAMTREELEQILDQALQDVTEHTAGVRLRQKDQPLGQDLCTVHITFDAGLSTSLTLCADTALLARMACNSFHEEAVTPEDVEEFSNEYFNVLCGKVAGAIFRATQVTYADEHSQGAQLIHHLARPAQDGAAAGGT